MPAAFEDEGVAGSEGVGKGAGRIAPGLALDLPTL